MMIKGRSLLRSIPIVNRFSASENGAKNWGFGDFRRGKILTLTIRPLGNQSHRNMLSGAKNGVDRCKNVVSGGGQEILYKK